MNVLKKAKLWFAVLGEYSQLSKKLTGKSNTLDLILSRILLNVPFPEYFNLCFYNKGWKGRKNYLVEDWPYHSKYNPGVTPDSDDDKIDLLLKTKQYMKRKVITNQNLNFDEFEKFTDSLSSFFYKPACSYGGKGIQKFYISDFASISDLYKKVKDLPVGLLEETVVQSKKMDELCPNLLQTIRFTVFKHKNGPKILFATVKTSIYNNAIVDNATSGGVFANINLDTGKIQTNAFRFLNSAEDIENFGKKLFDENGLSVHPVTRTQFKGFQIPYFQEAKNLVIDIASKVNFYDRRLLGIDIALSEKGPDLIEVNTTLPGMTHLWQVACKSTPVKPLLEEMLKE